jgi:hypothetical protein
MSYPSLAFPATWNCIPSLLSFSIRDKTFCNILGFLVRKWVGWKSTYFIMIFQILRENIDSFYGSGWFKFFILMKIKIESKHCVMSILCFLYM